MASKKLWRSAQRESNAPAATAAVHVNSTQAEDVGSQTNFNESRHCDASDAGAQADRAALRTICEEGESHNASNCGAPSLESEYVCAICEQPWKGKTYGCAHTGHWHGAFADCGIRCMQLGREIGKQHWGCCYTVDRNSLGCPRAKHVPTLRSSLASTQLRHREVCSSDKGVDAVDFYAEYHGHRPEHLSRLVQSLRTQGVEELVWLAGDSTLDNKYWLFPGNIPDLLPGATDYTAAAINGYEHVLVPPRMIMDVAYQLNKALVETDRMGNRRITAVNTSYEEGTLSDRAGDKLLPQDTFIRNHIRPQDTLVVSVGGNDIALKPSVKTAISALVMSRMSSLEKIEAGKAAGQGHFHSIFHTQTKKYVEKLIATTKPKRVIICTLYFLDEAQTGGWADAVLGHLGYNDDPTRLQAAIRHVFETATSKIQIDGVEVVPVPLFQALDGKTSSHYEERVEPSVSGGEMMAKLLADAILR